MKKKKIEFSKYNSSEIFLKVMHRQRHLFKALRIFLIIIMFALLITFILGSCKKVMFEEVKADFEIANTPAKMKTPTYFINKSDFATKWEWDFGDGYISNKRNPVNWYDTTGHYEVSLRASNKKQEDIIVKRIIVFLNELEEEKWK